jgi:hypothetical protein
MKKISDDIAHALDKCAEALSINELSRVTGVRIELLRRFITQKTRHVRGETWDKIYPVLRPYLLGPEAAKEKPPIRIGRAYRRHPDLVEMLSDQKILLDAFDVLPETEKSGLADRLSSETGAEPTSFSALSPLENRVMGAFLKLDAEARKKLETEVLEAATVEVRKRRAQLF